MEQNVNIEPQLSPETKLALAETLPVVLNGYTQLLRRDEAALKPGDDLGEKTKDELAAHIQQLETLKEFLTELSRNSRGFQTMVQQIDQNAGTFTAGIRRKNDRAFGEGRENSQTQIRFYVQIAQGKAALETRDEVIQAASLRGLSPDASLARAKRQQTSTSSITINTVRVYRENGKTRFDPQAGTRISLIGGNLEVSGITHEGTTPHYTDKGEVATPQNLGMGEYQTLINFAKARSGFKPPKGKK